MKSNSFGQLSDKQINEFFEGKETIAMKRNICFLFLVLLIAGSAQIIQAQKISLLGNQITFILPKGFKAVKKENVDFKFYSHNPVKTGCCISENIFSYFNQQENLGIDLSFIEPEKFGQEYDRDGIEQSNLLKLKPVLESMANKNGKTLKLMTNESVLKARKKWLHFVFQTPQNDDNKVYEQYLTDFQGYLMVFSVNFPTGQEKEKIVVNNIFRSLKVSEQLMDEPVINE